MSLFWCKITAISVNKQINSFQFLVILEIQYVENVANPYAAHLLHFMQGVMTQSVAAKMAHFFSVKNATRKIWIKLY